MGGEPDVSVVVPTRDRPEGLARCLAALERQSVRALEVIVVDDGSRRPEQVVAAVRAAPRARLVHIGGAGPAAARNAGVAAARGAVVCFTDDDCEPAADWIERLADVLAKGADATVGRTLNADAGDALAIASQLVTNHLMLASVDPHSNTAAFGPTTNLACRAEVASAARFDERYPSAAGEDREWCRHLRELGHALHVEPLAVVVHRPQLSPARFLRQQLRYGRAARRFRSRRRAATRLEPPSFYLDLIRGGFRESALVGLLVITSQVVVAVGFALEALVAAEPPGGSTTTGPST